MHTHSITQTSFFLQFFTLDDVALGSYGYGWTDRLNRSAMPALMMTTRKYNESCIDPATKIYFVSENIIIGISIYVCAGCLGRGWHYRSCQIMCWSSGSKSSSQFQGCDLYSDYVDLTGI